MKARAYISRLLLHVQRIGFAALVSSMSSGAGLALEDTTKNTYVLAISHEFDSAQQPARREKQTASERQSNISVSQDM